MITLCFMDERARWSALQKTLAIMPNQFPVSALALLMFPREHREHLMLEDLESAVAFADRFPQYLIFHNMRGSGASRPEHAHLQAVARREPLAIERTARTPLLSTGDVAVSRLPNYPIYGLVVSGPNRIPAAYVIMTEIQAGDSRQGRISRPFNIVLTGQEVIVIPRAQESPSGFEGAFAGLEMAGGIVVTARELFERLTGSEITRALAECGIGHAEQVALESTIKRRLGG